MTLGPARFDFVGNHAIQQGADWVRGFRLVGNALPAPPFAVSTHYAVGEYATPSTGNGLAYLVVVAGTPAAEPVWPTTLGERVVQNTTTFLAVGSTRLIDTTGYTAEMDVRASNEGATLFTATTSNARLFTGFDPPKWAAATAYGLGQQAVPTVLNGWVYQAVVAGTSHATTEPTWPTTPGATAADGSVTWRNVGADDGVTNLRIALVPADTAAVAAFANAPYNLEWTDAGGRVTRPLQGYATLSRELAR